MIPPAAKVETKPGAPRSFARRHPIKLVLSGLVGSVALVAGLYTAVTLTFSYADGDRIGFVQKLSKKGWICKTWEGELAMSPVPGAAPQVFPFTVPDEAVALRINQAAGKRVALDYKQKRGVPSSCFGETEYFVHNVRVVAQ